MIGGTLPTNPFAVTSWHAAHWASDPSSTPPADGAPVPNGTGWRDGSGDARAPVQVFGTPIYRASVATFNNRPAIELDGIDYYMQGVAFTTVSRHPHTFVLVFQSTSTHSSRLASGLLDGRHWWRRVRYIDRNWERPVVFVGGARPPWAGLLIRPSTSWLPT